MPYQTQTTLVRRIAEHDDPPFITLDDEQSRRFVPGKSGIGRSCLG